MAEDAEPCRPQPPARRVHRGRAHRIRHRGPGADALPAGVSGLMGVDPVKLGFGFLGGPHLRSLVDIGRAAEQAGFDSLWHAETRITRDSVTAMAALLMATERVRVGSAAINVYTRGAALVA